MNCPHCGESLGTIRDAFCPYCRGSLNQADSEDHVVGKVGGTRTTSVGLVAFCRGELAKAFRSRETILYDFYEQVFERLEPDVLDEMNLEDFRTLYLAEHMPEEMRFPGCVSVRERKVVIASRCVGAWSVFWMSILPASMALIGSSIPSNVTLIQRAGVFAMVFVLLFPLGALAGFSLGNLVFGRPFIAIMNRLLNFGEAVASQPRNSRDA